MEWLTSPEAWVALLTLTVLEIVLGVDNIIFISILAGKLPADQRDRARKTGLSLAMFIRIALLLSITWVMGLTAPLFAVLGHAITGRDVILIVGGLFLIAKSTHEIHLKLEGDEHGADGKAAASFAAVIVQILLLDIVFSLDSVITAVGMAKKVPVMIAALVIAVGVMLVSAASIGSFIERHPSMKILALSFLLLIGVMLLAEGMGQHVSKGYIYFAMAFALFVEVVNMRLRNRKRKPVKLHGRFEGNA
jgi:predicted tellurium resistance membrane protein TerC